MTTGFHNFIMPFIRYDTGDYARWSNTQCECGRGLPLLQSIAGRVQEFLVTRVNTLISATSLNMHNDLFDRVYEYQFVQRQPGQAELRLVPKPDFGDNELTAIAQHMKSVSSSLIDFDVVTTKQMTKTKGGKQPTVIQHISGGVFKQHTQYPAGLY